MGEKDYVVDFKSHYIPAYVLEEHTGDDVARAMIESGQQVQPFYIFNMDEAYRRVQHFKQMLPRVKIFYAVKANDTEEMLRLTVALGLGFDCASPGEIHKIRKLNVHPENIIYAMPCKTIEEMEYARQAGVKLTTFDNSYELKKIKKSWPDARILSFNIPDQIIKLNKYYDLTKKLTTNGYVVNLYAVEVGARYIQAKYIYNLLKDLGQSRLQLLIRIRIDGAAKKKLGLKFGCDFESEATKLLDEAAGFGLTVAGVAFHVGSICYSPESYVLSLQYVKALFDYEAKNGRRMNIVDIGGGFLSDRTDNIDEVSRLINDTLDELFPDPTVQIIAEPGRYLCDSAFKMFCRVIGLRKVIRNNVPVNMIYLNNGVYGTMHFDENWHKIYKFQHPSEPEPLLNEDTILWGPTCDSIDRVMQDYKIHLPQCSPDDWLVVDIHGAYTFTFSTRFSCIDIPFIRSIVSMDLWNLIKTSSVYQSSDFVLNPDISTPLPSSLPPVLLVTEKYEHSDTPIQKV